MKATGGEAVLIFLLIRAMLAIIPIATSDWLRDLVNWLPNPF